MKNNTQLKTKIILELIKEGDKTTKQIMKLCNMSYKKVIKSIGILRHNQGQAQIETKPIKLKNKNIKYVYHWLDEKDSLDDYKRVINSRHKKTMKQNNLSNLTNTQTLELSHKNPKIFMLVQNSQNEKGEQALLK